MGDALILSCACGGRLKVAAAAAGKKAKCPKCGAHVAVPVHPAVATTAAGFCPACNRTKAVRPRRQGGYQCAYCGEVSEALIEVEAPPPETGREPKLESPERRRLPSFEAHVRAVSFFTVIEGLLIIVWVIANYMLASKVAEVRGSHGGSPRVPEYFYAGLWIHGLGGLLKLLTGVLVRSFTPGARTAFGAISFILFLWQAFVALSVIGAERGKTADLMPIVILSAGQAIWTFFCIGLMFLPHAREVYDHGYGNLVDRTPEVPPTSSLASPFFWLGLIVVAGWLAVWLPIFTQAHVVLS